MEKRLRLVVVDDDDLILQTIRMSLPNHWQMVGVNSLSELKSEKFDAAFVDMHLTGNLQKAEGIKVISALLEQDPHLEVVAISGHLDQKIMEDCLKSGASRFLAKPLSREEIQLTLNKIEALHLLRDAKHRSYGEVRWVGNSKASQEVKKLIAQMRGERGPILIEGDSGTGKEVVAQLIHLQEGEGNLVQINVAALPENIFESEFFGHVRGSFTGADQNKIGLAEAAHGGTLFLDEVEALPMALQAKLLRFLESGEVRRVGSRDFIKVKTRVIAATNQNLDSLVKEGNFREDLLWRLSGKKINLPPLRDRLDDLSDLANHFLQLERPKRNKTLSPEALDIMKNYKWPGNVRELKRVIEQLSLLSPLPIIRREDVVRVLQPLVSVNLDSIDLKLGLDRLCQDYEKKLISMALAQYKEVDEVARVLDVSRSNLYKKIKDLGINLEEFK